MKTRRWDELARWARDHSPYYRDLYREVKGFERLSDLPAAEQTGFWAANTVRGNRLLTSDPSDGIVFRSGGTTGNPKFSIFSHEEWNLFTRVFGEGMKKFVLSRGDRLGNLFYVGELYGSFLLIQRSIEISSVPVLQFPIGGAAPVESILKTMNDFQVNVVAGVPTTLFKTIDFLEANRTRYPEIRIEKILFAGESIYPDQRKRLPLIFPGIKVLSVGYASIDAGLLGYTDEDCGPDEHRTFGEVTILEIVDEETGEPIEEPDRPGKLLCTSLVRALMPIIRYPVGDRAAWKEPFSGGNRDRKFAILGRSEEAARVGPVSLYYDDVRSLIAEASPGIPAFQLVIRHFETKDELVLRAASPQGKFEANEAAKEIMNLLHAERPLFAHAVKEKLIHPLTVEWVASGELETSPRTGKLLRVIDQRKSGR